jgi:hypothetical protein
MSTVAHLRYQVSIELGSVEHPVKSYYRCCDIRSAPNSTFTQQNVSRADPYCLFRLASVVIQLQMSIPVQPSDQVSIEFGFCDLILLLSRDILSPQNPSIVVT